LGRGEKEIPARLIGQKVMMELKLLDDVAYIRFASVYRTFKDVQEFVETLEDQENMDAVDPTQLSLTPERSSENAPSVPRTRPPDPVPN
jgi:transcriptional repressor NrdR